MKVLAKMYNCYYQLMEPIGSMTLLLFRLLPYNPTRSRSHLLLNSHLRIPRPLNHQNEEIDNHNDQSQEEIPQTEHWSPASAECAVFELKW